MGHILLIIAWVIVGFLTAMVVVCEFALVRARMRFGAYYMDSYYTTVREVCILAGLLIATLILSAWLLISDQPQSVEPSPPQPSPTPTAVTAPTAAPTPMEITGVGAYPSRAGWYEVRFSMPFRCSGQFALELEDGTRSQRSRPCGDTVHRIMQLSFHPPPLPGSVIIALARTSSARITGENGSELGSYRLPHPVVIE